MSKYKLKTLSDEEWMYDVPDEMCEVYIDIFVRNKEYSYDEIEELRIKYPDWWIKTDNEDEN